MNSEIPFIQCDNIPFRIGEMTRFITYQLKIIVCDFDGGNNEMKSTGDDNFIDMTIYALRKTPEDWAYVI